MNSILGWNDNWTVIFEANLTLKCWSLSIVFVGAVYTIWPGLYRDLMFHFNLKSSVVVYELTIWFSI